MAMYDEEYSVCCCPRQQSVLACRTCPQLHLPKQICYSCAQRLSPTTCSSSWALCWSDICMLQQVQLASIGPCTYFRRPYEVSPMQQGALCDDSSHEVKSGRLHKSCCLYGRVQRPSAQFGSLHTERGACLWQLTDMA